MRRTIAFGHTAAAQWDVRAEEELPGSEPELTQGRRAYAAEHADTERRTCALLERNWGPILRRADAYLDNTLDSRDAGQETGTDTERRTYARLEREWEALQRREAATEAVTVVLDIGDELEPDEEEALLEGDQE
jgi:hypothetical protein